VIELSIIDLVLISAILALAGLIHGVFGIGFPMIATPLLAMFMDVQSAVLITLFPTIAVNLLSIYKGGGWGDSIGRFWPLALFAFVGGILGTNLLVVSDPEPFRLALAGIIILYLNLHRLTRIKMSWVEDHIYLSMLLFGLVAGMFGGSVNVMVPILLIFALELGLAKTVMIQTFNMCFLSGKVAQVGVFSGVGLIDMDLLSTVAVGLVLAVAALWFGMSLRDKIHTDLYQKILRKLLLLMACILVGQYFSS
jgi:uncharacterized membrane protein YfcA